MRVSNLSYFMWLKACHNTSLLVKWSKQIKSTLEYKLENYSDTISLFLQEPVFKTSFALKRPLWPLHILAQRGARRGDNWLTCSPDNRKVMGFWQLKAFWRRARTDKPLLHMKASASPLGKQCTTLCLSDPSQLVWSPPCNTSSCNRNLIVLLQGKNITCFVSRLISCSVFGTTHSISSELHVMEGEAISSTAAAVQ